MTDDGLKKVKVHVELYGVFGGSGGVAFTDILSQSIKIGEETKKVLSNLPEYQSGEIAFSEIQAVVVQEKTCRQRRVFARISADLYHEACSIAEILQVLDIRIEIFSSNKICLDWQP